MKENITKKTLGYILFAKLIFDIHYELFYSPVEFGDHDTIGHLQGAKAEVLKTILNLFKSDRIR